MIIWVTYLYTLIYTYIHTIQCRHTYEYIFFMNKTMWKEKQGNHKHEIKKGISRESLEDKTVNCLIRCRR